MKHKNVKIKSSFKLRLVLAIGTLILFFVTPISIFWDSYLYLGSSESLFTSNFASNYHWVREPGYPLLIKLMSYGIGIQGIIFFQFLLTWSGVILFVESLKNIFKTNEETKYLYLGSFLSLAIAAGYASSVLQQTYFIFAVALAINILVVPRNNLTRILLTLLIAVFSSLISVILFCGLISIFLFHLISTRVFDRERLKQSFALFLVIFLSGSTVTATWYGFKSTQDPTARIYQDAWNFWEFDNTWEFRDANLVKQYAYRISEAPSVIFALSQFGVETTYKEKGLVSGETQVFVANKFLPEHTCGRYFPGPQDYIEKTRIKIPSVCRNTFGIKPINALHLFLVPAIPFLGLLAFLIALYAPFLFGLRTSVLILFPIVSLSPYILSSAGASRYGAPQLVYAPLLIAIAITSLRKNEKLSRTIR